jgi:uncharacterized protein YecE (DUF72 family)
VLTVKAPRWLTHAKRLHPDDWLKRIAHGLSHLGPKRGVLLVQLPPTMAFDYARLAYFLERVPAWIRVAVEFRHPSSHEGNVFELLEKHGPRTAS